MLGNPNVGKSSLFNTLAGRKQKTSNFPGTTQDSHIATIERASDSIMLVDLPGVYSLNLKQNESEVCRGVLDGLTRLADFPGRKPDAIMLVLDGTNLLRNLRLAGEVLSLRLPTLVVVTMLDEARRHSIHIDADRLEAHLGCPVLLVSNTTGEGIGSVVSMLDRVRVSAADVPCEVSKLEHWADDVYADVASAPIGESRHDRLTDRLDRAFTHPVLGVLLFAATMTGLFWVIFSFAAIPMAGIDWLFASLGSWLTEVLPAGAVRDLLTDGVVAGIGGTVVFLPQILLLFFLIALLEQTGYLARAAFVIDRVLSPFGLPGHAFVPLLSAHACAIPAIMSARAIPDRRERLATILVIPFMSCSARIPVYVLLTSVLFPGHGALQAVAFTGCYVLGIVAGLGSAVILRGTILRGTSRPMALELPRYRLPSVMRAGRESFRRGMMFVRKAGTVILGISVLLWWLGAYPISGPSPAGETLRAQATAVGVEAPDRAAALLAQAERADAQYAAGRTFLGRIGSAVQPVFEPLGADRQLTVGILASFAAREVFVSTMAVQVAGTDDPAGAGVFEAISQAKRADGARLLSPATSWALLVYFVLAMQCLPTLVVTAREAGGWRWAALQFGWMSTIAYGAAAAVHAVLVVVGVG
ncbi:MAG TPA: ferrous iron transporter B [Phycisphaerales bacterium]|nr:ferrous iron transporter B [Phycisphaerales bacterium]